MSFVINHLHRTAVWMHIRDFTTILGKKLPQCEVCRKSCASNADLVRHRRKHTGEKPFNCDFCDKSFVHTGGLNKHIRNIHRVI